LNTFVRNAARRLSSARSLPLWRLGFRPFYLLASGFAAISVALWAVEYQAWAPRSYLATPLWHAHEMLYGFTLAVMAGFLFTAVRNWTNRPTPSGGWLMAIAALWIAGRVLILSPWGWASAFVNAAFPIAVAIGIGIPLLQSRNRRNYFFIGLLVAIGIAAFCVHASLLLDWPLPPWLGIRLALDVVLLIMSVMSGRVIPMFTANAIPGAGSRRHLFTERASLGSVVALAALDLIQVEGAGLALFLMLAATIHAVRWWLWAPLKTLRTPLVWILHAAYAWIPVYFVLRAAATVQWIASPIAVHALTVGAIGGLTIGMMTRTAKGHTGRPLRAEPADITCYVLVLSSAALRVFGPLLVPQAYGSWILASSALFSLGFAIYAVSYWRPLTQPRPDGKPG
jgi:uncharacterized protein involved in response to NO